MKPHELLFVCENSNLRDRRTRAGLDRQKPEQKGEIPKRKGNAMSFRKAVLAGTAAAAAVVTVGAGTAMASPMPRHPAPAPRPEAFTLTVNGLTDTGTGNATGPVRGAFTDKELSATDSTWAFGRGSVDVRHTAVTATPTGFTPANSCTASVSATGTWALRGLTGVDRETRGHGTFTANITEVVTENTTFKIERVIKYVRIRVRNHERDRSAYGQYKWIVIRVVRFIKVPVQTCDATKPLSVTVNVTGSGTATNDRDHFDIRANAKV